MQTDAKTAGLGSLVDANLGADSAKSSAVRQRYSLALESVGIIGQRSRDVLLGLFRTTPTPASLRTAAGSSTSAATSPAGRA